MNIVHVSTTDRGGGSARSARRIHSGLRELGVDSRMLVGLRRTDDPEVALIAGSELGRKMDRVAGLVGDSLGLQYWTHVSSLRIGSHPWVRRADVVQLYNLHGSYFNPFALRPLGDGRPLVWRLSDMWPFTGHCAYPYGCDRWKTGCHSCPDLSNEIAIPRDTTRLLWKTKGSIYQALDLTIVAPSRWMKAQAEQSPLFQEREIHLIPNGVATQVFHPQDRGAARLGLGLPMDARVVMFSADSLTNPRKGGHLALRALESLRASGERFVALLVGADPPQDLPFPSVTPGRIGDDAVMARCYSAADVFVLPTLAENLPNAVLESLACGTPVVAFDIGGMPDAVRHLETGYLCESVAPECLAHGISLLLGDEPLRSALSTEALRMIREEHGVALEVQRFRDLYSGLLEPAGSAPAGALRSGPNRP